MLRHHALEDESFREGLRLPTAFPSVDALRMLARGNELLMYSGATTMKYEKRSQVSMKGHPALTERWLQGKIVADPSLLGFGDVRVAAQEKSLPGRGRLDLLLLDDDKDIRYEVELQLGATDESHIIRTLEYWDLERRHYPHSEHVAVIVAEDITARFFNVIRLFNGFIPIVAIKVTALDLGQDNVTLIFTRVLDHQVQVAGEDEGPAIVADREYWEKASKPELLALMDDLLSLIQRTDPSVRLNYNQQYVGLRNDNRATNYVAFVPKKNQLNVEIRLPRTASYDSQIDDSEIRLNRYDKRGGQYKLVVQRGMSEDSNRLLQELFRDAYQHYLS